MVGHRHHCALVHGFDIGSEVFDLPQLDAMAPDLDLPVGTSQEFERTVVEDAGAVTGPVHPAAVPARVSDEPGGGLGRSSEIS
ncbi:MAG: hypothetical protein WBF80_07440, partial [Rhodococcus sp. (in: high G+C Gram-positive bacteria)]